MPRLRPCWSPLVTRPIPCNISPPEFGAETPLSWPNQDFMTYLAKPPNGKTGHSTQLSGEGCSKPCFKRIHEITRGVRAHCLLGGGWYFLGMQADIGGHVLRARTRRRIDGCGAWLRMPLTSCSGSWGGQTLLGKQYIQQITQAIGRNCPRIQKGSWLAQRPIKV